MRVKFFPDGSREYLVASRNIFREPGWELGDEFKRPERSEGSTDIADSRARAKRRARAAVRDIALSNPDFRYFVTLTLDAAKVDRYDPDAIVKKMSMWCDNRVRRNGLKYLLIPEYHKDGAIHFHGFFNDALPVEDSGTLSVGGKPRRPRSEAQRAAWRADGAQIVYNLPGWSYGYTTAMELYGERSAAVGYVCKYITKAGDKIGGRWYYSGGALARPDVGLFDVDFEDIDADGFDLPALGVRCKTWRDDGGKEISDLG